MHSSQRQKGSGKRDEELITLEIQMTNANRRFALGTYVELSDPYKHKKPLNYWVSNTAKAVDVIEYNKLPRTEQFERAYKELKKDKILEKFTKSLTPYISE